MALSQNFLRKQSMKKEREPVPSKLGPLYSGRSKGHMWPHPAVLEPRDNPAGKGSEQEKRGMELKNYLLP